MEYTLHSPNTPHNVAILDTEALDAWAQNAAASLIREGESENTRKSYEGALRYWAGWFFLRYAKPITLPVNKEVVIQFIVDHAQRTTPNGLEVGLPEEIERVLVEQKIKGKMGPLSLSTIEHRISALSKIHMLWNQPNPCQDGAVKELLTMTRRGYVKRGQVSRGSDALTRDKMEKLIDVCEADDSLTGIRDKALLLFAWASGGRRRSEVVSASVENTRQVGAIEFEYNLVHSKTNQTGRSEISEIKPIVGKAGLALAEWLAATTIVSGPLFRQINRGGQIGGALSSSGVNRIVKARCKQAGFEGNFTAHSLRSGFITEAGRRNIPLAEAMAMSGHASTRTFLSYFRAGELSESRAASLLDD